MTEKKEKLFEVRLPLPSFRRKGKNILLGLNDYRNLHYHILNRAKVNYKGIVFSVLTREQLFSRLGKNLSVFYYISFARKNKKDLSNYGTVIDKFFLDALVDAGIIADDRIPIVKESRYIWDGYGKDEVRVEIWGEAAWKST